MTTYFSHDSYPSGSYCNLWDVGSRFSCSGPIITLSLHDLVDLVEFNGLGLHALEDSHDLWVLNRLVSLQNNF